ncbi:MAG: nuclear transport factor 2 family protein [Actinomycetota bacterium]
MIDTMRRFVAAAEAGDGPTMHSLMSDDFVGYVTTADAGVRTASREEYIASIDAMDVASAGLQLDIPNVVATAPDQVLAMIEVHAARNGRTLHNFTGQLATMRDGCIVELWMVEALPAESDAFWSA